MLTLTAYNAITATPLGGDDTKVGIQVLAGQLTAIDFLPSCATIKSPDNATAALVADQLEAYFSNGSFRFNLALQIRGSQFQNKVWRLLMDIRAGETRTYGCIAYQLHSSARAVGNACKANPIPLVIPCHRVLAKNGIGGYCGQTDGQRLRIKQWLLEHERGCR